MRVFAALAAAGILAVACSSPAAAPSPTRTPSPTPSPSPSPTPANVFKATLSPANEVPPITSPEASCAGEATVTFASSTSAKFDVVIRGCPASTVINIGHIHEGAAGANGPVVVNTGLTAGELTLTGGGITFSKTNSSADAAVIARIIANPAGFYVNFHSAAHGGGVIRGQLTKG